MCSVNLYVVCCVLVMDVYNDKVVGINDDTTAHAVTYTGSEAISIPMIEDITKDNNFVDVSYVCVRVCVWCGVVCSLFHKS